MSEARGKNRKVLVVLMLVVSGMFVFSFVLIPIYGWMRNIYGFGAPPATTQATAGQDAKIVQHALNAGIDKTRTVTLQFVVLDNRKLQAEFRPMVNQLDVNPGEVRKVTFFAKNLSDKEIVVRVVPSVLPARASKYLVRVGSFSRETLKPHEAKTMPLKIVVDRGVPGNIPVITLSYQIIGLKTAVTASDAHASREMKAVRLARN